jgi:NitT/TauT family transport system substrate-binding protein
MTGWRGVFVLTLGALSIACASPAPAPSAASKPAEAKPATQPQQAPTTVRIATLRSASDAGLFIAIDKGYFTEQGIEADFAEFGLGSDIAAMMAAEQIQVGGAAITAGLLNAAARGADIKVVADKGSMLKGFGFGAILVRKDLVDTGAYASPADLKGKRIGVPDLVSGGTIGLDALLQKGGLTLDDAEIISMPFPDQLPALANKAIDVAYSIEPFVTIAAAQGIAVRAVGMDEVLDGQQIAVLMYSPKFAGTESAKRFMVAYVKALRDYNDAFVKKQDLDAMAERIAKYSTTSDPAMIKRMVPAGLNPNGYVNLKSIEGDLEWYARRGHVPNVPALNKLVDNSYVDFAVQQLGRYAQ